MPHWPLLAVRDLTRDGSLSTYGESVLKLSKVSFRGKFAHTGHPLKLPSPTKFARLGNFFLQLARRTAVPAWCSVLYLFSGYSMEDIRERLNCTQVDPSSSTQLTLPGVQPGAARYRSSHSPPPPPPSIPVKTMENYRIFIQIIWITFEIILRLDSELFEATVYAKLSPFARSLFNF